MNIVKSAVPFHLYKSPLVVSQTLELSRRILNPIYHGIYRKFVEPTFTMDGFLSGAKQSAALVAALVRESRYDRLNEFMTTASTRQLRYRISELSSEQIQKYFTFTQDDVVLAFNHSSFISSYFIISRDQKSPNFTFYSTFVLFIDPKDPKNKSRTVNQLLHDDVLICNITVARLLFPPGRWRITDINFFNSTFVNATQDVQFVTMV